jgi:hypothetical protein
MDSMLTCHSVCGVTVRNLAFRGLSRGVLFQALPVFACGVLTASLVIRWHRDSVASRTRLTTSTVKPRRVIWQPSLN